MKKPTAIAIASLGLTLLGLGAIASCKQGEGERCQVQADCEDGLTCNEAEKICRGSAKNSQDIDAPLAPDAAPDAM
ncbi:MAG TPA: hypothetical protein VN253_21680 [Kofleriaceae bacterium]|nr:hypothetical protein [Kofleriaceae bacterium]